MKWALISLIVASTRAEMLSTFDAKGNSQVVWSDDGSYGVQVFNKVDGDGKVRIIEYAKVTDSNFVRDSFTFNTDYTRNPLNEVFGIVGVDTNNVYAVGLSSGGTLDNGNGWSLVDSGNLLGRQYVAFSATVSLFKHAKRCPHAHASPLSLQNTPQPDPIPV